jgi:hypothetical protein
LRNVYGRLVWILRALVHKAQPLVPALDERLSREAHGGVVVGIHAAERAGPGATAERVDDHRPPAACVVDLLLDALRAGLHDDGARRVAPPGPQQVLDLLDARIGSPCELQARDTLGLEQINEVGGEVIENVRLGVDKHRNRRRDRDR